MVDRVVAASPGPRVLDVGIGTGIAARQFRAAGCTVLGVEPDPRMADFARRSGFEVDVATFEAWEPAGRQFDAVIAGQTWHWVDPAVGAVKAAQVLKPGGRLAVFWNAGQPAPEASAAFAEIYARIVPDAPSTRVYRQGAAASELYAVMVAVAVEGVRRTGAFGDPEEWRFERDQHYTHDGWLDQLPTLGDHSRFPPGKLDEVIAAVGNAIDGLGGGFTMHVTTMLVSAAVGPGDGSSG